MNTKADFQVDSYYHIYNRTNNKEALFKSDENRTYFLKQYNKYLGPYLEFFAYALMSNHFHFSVKVKSKEEINTFINNLDSSELTVALKRYKESASFIEQSDHIIPEQRDRIATSDTISDVIIGQHRRFFISYTQAINKRYNRQGNLFADRFKRSQYDPHLKFRYLQYYIHHNGRKHGIVKDFKSYEYHSYQEIITDCSDLIDRSKVLDWYEGIEDFIAFHESVQYEDAFRDIDVEGLLG